jgi:hypothetical protein
MTGLGVGVRFQLQADKISTVPQINKKYRTLFISSLLPYLDPMKTDEITIMGR